MKIIELRTENIKNLKAIQIRPKDGAVVLEGKNGAGKSAILDSIFIALTGKKIEQPIRNGEARAEINVDLGDYKIKRVFTEKGDRLEVLSKEGSPLKTPQTLLNSIFGNMSFDPLEFSGMKEKPQRELLAKLVKLDFTELNEKRENLYNERTRKNREIKGGDAGQYRQDPFAPLPLESLVSSMEVPAPDTPRQEISMTKELAKIDAMENMRKDYLKECSEVDKFNTDAKSSIDENLECLEAKISDDKGEVRRIDCEIAVLEQELDKKKNERAAFISQINADVLTCSDLLSKPVEHKDYPQEPITEQEITSAKQALKDIEAKNISIRKAIEYDKKQAELKAAKDVISKLEEDMMKIDIEKDRRIKEAVFPIEGLGITDTSVVFNGKPFSQLSTGEQIKVSTAIAMALNPELRVILIRDGSLLDKEGMELIESIAKHEDYQLWIERVADDKGVGIFIEEGEIVAE